MCYSIFKIYMRVKYINLKSLMVSVGQESGQFTVGMVYFSSSSVWGLS